MRIEFTMVLYELAEPLKCLKFTEYTLSYLVFYCVLLFPNNVLLRFQNSKILILFFNLHFSGTVNKWLGNIFCCLCTKGFHFFGTRN